MITGEFVPYLVSFLNSYLFKFCFRDSFPELGNGREVRKIFFDKIPVKKPSPHLNQLCEDILENLLEALDKNESIKDYEIQLNNMIFDHYNISKEEQEIIKESLPNYFKI
jgi:hypothetical protein